MAPRNFVAATGLRSHRCRVVVCHFYPGRLGGWTSMVRVSLQGTLSRSRKLSASLLMPSWMTGELTSLQPAIFHRACHTHQPRTQSTGHPLLVLLLLLLPLPPPPPSPASLVRPSGISCASRRAADTEHDGDMRTCVCSRVLRAPTPLLLSHCYYCIFILCSMRNHTEK